VIWTKAESFFMIFLKQMTAFLGKITKGGAKRLEIVPEIVGRG